MKARVVSVFAVVLVASVAQLLASSLISKARAEKDALAAVGGGTIIQAVLETNMGKKTWSVDVAGAAHEYEVWVDAHTGAILKIITQPPAIGASIMLKAQAENQALAAVGEGTVLQSVLETNMGKKTWSVDILSTDNEHEVWVDAHSGATLKIITQPLAALAPCKFISKATAEKHALAAVGGGKVLSAVLEKTDNPPVWSVNVVSTKGSEYEVKVNACTGAIVAIIVGG
jgi:uncharacterized membrane protein YkoI